MPTPDSDTSHGPIGDTRPDDELSELFELTIALAVGAGRRARRWRQDGFTISAKSTPTDLVTELDHAVEEWITQQLAIRRPGDGLIGEEGANVGATTGVRWLIDPIDGTVNFALGLPHYAVSVAVEVDGQTVAGCVHDPETGEVFYARLGQGAFLARDSEREHAATDSYTDIMAAAERLHGPRSVTLTQAVIGTGFSYNAKVRANQGAVVAALLPRIADVRRMGAASLDLCAVAAGRLDAYFEAGLNPWDWAAGLLVATESGCVSSGLRARPAGNHFTAIAAADLAADLFAVLSDLNADEVLL